MNAFADYALNHAPKPVARKIRRDLAKPVFTPKTASEKKQHEDGQLLAQYRRFKKGQEQWLYASPIGPEVQGLVLMLDQATLEDAGDFLTELSRATSIKAAPKDARELTFELLDRAIIRLRKRHELPAFSDPLPPEPTIQQLMKQELGL